MPALGHLPNERSEKSAVIHRRVPISGTRRANRGAPRRLHDSECDARAGAIGSCHRAAAPEMLLKREGQIITDAIAIPDDLAVTESLLAFTRAEKALQTKDLPAMMQFYAAASQLSWLTCAGGGANLRRGIRALSRAVFNASFFRNEGLADH